MTGWTPSTVKKSRVTNATRVRVGSARPDDARDDAGVLRHRLEGAILVAEVVEVRIGEAGVGAAVVHLPDRHEPVRFRVRQRPQQHAVDDAEDGRRRADAERQRGITVTLNPGRLPSRRAACLRSWTMASSMWKSSARASSVSARSADCYVDSARRVRRGCGVGSWKLEDTHGACGEPGGGCGFPHGAGGVSPHPGLPERRLTLFWPV